MVRQVFKVCGSCGGVQQIDEATGRCRSCGEQIAKPRPQSKGLHGIKVQDGASPNRYSE